MCVFCFFFFFKQKTAYEMRISDWSSDVCSSDLIDVKKLSDAIVDHLKRKGALWILFDNIDKGWTPTGIDASDILTLKALLEASRKLQRSLTADGVEARSLFFLRNDVYELLLDRTADRGKEQKDRKSTRLNSSH